MDIIEQIRQSFIEQLQDDDWHITDVRPSTEEVYRDYAHQVGAIGTYVIEMTAMRDIDGMNKHGQYNKAYKGTKILYTAFLFSDGTLKTGWMEVLPSRASGGALTVHGDSLKASGQSWHEITPGYEL